MWVRKRIEIGPRQLCKAMWDCFRPGERERLYQQIARTWKAHDALVFLSVRSGFDALLQTARWPAGSEIIMSGLTIPDMSRIVEENGMVAVGVDVDMDTMAPDIDEVASKINSRTRAIVIAHLFGGLCDITPLVKLARRHGLLVIEDCAQAYVGNDYQGDERADVSMFSFGPIKTNTTLGGALIRVRDRDLNSRLRQAHRQWPVQTRFTYFRRVIKYAMVKGLSTRLISSMVCRTLRLAGRNHDALATTMARGFAGPRFFERIRRQPSIPLLYMLRDKLSRFDSRRIVQRQRLGNYFVNRCEGIRFAGLQMIRPTYWVMPILVKNRQQLVEKLWREGFDATTNCSLVSIVAGSDRPSQGPTSDSEFVLENIVFLPFDTKMPKKEIARMAEIINEFRPIWPERRQIGESPIGNRHPSGEATVSDATVVSR